MDLLIIIGCIFWPVLLLSVYAAAIIIFAAVYSFIEWVRKPQAVRRIEALERKRERQLGIKRASGNTWTVFSNPSPSDSAQDGP